MLSARQILLDTVNPYSIFTGRGVELDAMALPDLGVEMESYIPEQSEEVKTDPPCD